ncbi:PTS sugar transporter subunit IIA [Thermoanaerobacterium thermosaccharolyticum]|uniref:PTS sugar transporter subunit IIA n=1 Tax=Thermoanaerobacterium thermosaccharolyticum TaxID=1517 RepID=UPI000C083802|nr:PTS sugar transporter subunit IIA [Thermoanaerobacterium thermosaccharolyticum]PHO06716.1 PTS fructose transporter subunit IIA [Thermoanaerobacterium thermosaccharolyticum]
MKKIIILIGHGNYATGLKSSIDLIAGVNSDLYAIDFTEKDSDVTLKEKIKNALNKNFDAQVLFVSDIAGGTPYKVAAEIANCDDNMELVAGCNLSSLLEAIFQKDSLTISELAEFIVNVSKNSTMRFRKVLANHVNIIQETEDGI